MSHRRPPPPLATPSHPPPPPTSQWQSAYPGGGAPAAGLPEASGYPQNRQRTASGYPPNRPLPQPLPTSGGPSLPNPPPSASRYPSSSTSGYYDGPRVPQEPPVGYSDLPDDPSRPESHSSSSCQTQGNNAGRNAALKRGQSCRTCRVRKLKCTGERPQCSVCVKTRDKYLKLLNEVPLTNENGERVDKRGRKRKPIVLEEPEPCTYEVYDRKAGGGLTHPPKGKMRRMDDSGQTGSEERAMDAGMGGSQDGQSDESVELRDEMKIDCSGDLKEFGQQVPAIVVTPEEEYPKPSGNNFSWVAQQGSTMSSSDPSFPSSSSYPSTTSSDRGPWSGLATNYGSIPLQTVASASTTTSQSFARQEGPFRDHATGGPTPYPQPENIFDPALARHPILPLAPADLANYAAGGSTHWTQTGRNEALVAMPMQGPMLPSIVTLGGRDLGPSPVVDAPVLGNMGVRLENGVEMNYIVKGFDISPPPEGKISMLDVNGDICIPLGSALEYALIYHVLPYTHSLSMPIYYPRLSTCLRSNGEDRTHPALRFILYAEALKFITGDFPPPPEGCYPKVSADDFPPAHPGWIRKIKDAVYDRKAVLAMLPGNGPFCELAELCLARSRKESETTPTNASQFVDLLHAVSGITRYLYSVGRFVDGWKIPCTRLVISCGLHRIRSHIFTPPTTFPTIKAQDLGGPSPPFSIGSVPSDDRGSTSGSAVTTDGTSSTTTKISGILDANAPINPVLPSSLRMKPTLIAGPADQMDLAERIHIFWAIRGMDWAAGVGWGWAISMADSDCQTPWPRQYKDYLMGSVPNDLSGIWDLFNPKKGQAVRQHDNKILALQSLGILHKANTLFDLAFPLTDEAPSESDYPLKPHTMTIDAIQTVQNAITSFRGNCIPKPVPEHFVHDPWWIMCITNLHVAEMLLYGELAKYEPGCYEFAVRAAREMVAVGNSLEYSRAAPFLDLIVPINFSLTARFLCKESQRLASARSNPDAVTQATNDSNALMTVLLDHVGKWCEMAKLHGKIVERVQQGLPEKNNEFARN